MARSAAMNNFIGLLVKWTESIVSYDQRYIATPTAFPNDFCESKLNPTLVTEDARSGRYTLPVPFFVFWDLAFDEKSIRQAVVMLARALG